MKEYSKSKITKMKLINAAGEIVINEGLHALTVRAVAKQAGEQINSVHYHFGGKEGLYMETVRYAVSEWVEYNWSAYVKRNIDLFSTLSGKVKVIKDLVDIHFRLVFLSEKPSWCLHLLNTSMQVPGDGRDYILENFGNAHYRMLQKVYKLIIPEGSISDAHMWAMFFMAPFLHATIFLPHTLMAPHFKMTGTKYFPRLKSYLLRIYLLSLNLPSDLDK